MRALLEPSSALHECDSCFPFIRCCRLTYHLMRLSGQYFLLRTCRNQYSVRCARLPGHRELGMPTWRFLSMFSPVKASWRESSREPAGAGKVRRLSPTGRTYPAYQVHTRGPAPSPILRRIRPAQIACGLEMTVDP